MFDFLKEIYTKDGLSGVIVVMVLAIVFVAMQLLIKG